MRSYYVYIMGNRSGTLYIGVTNDLERRILEHRAGLGRFTEKYRLVKLLYYEVTDDVYAAICQEKQLKGWLREKKLALIRSQNPAMKDLAPELFGWRAGSSESRDAQPRPEAVLRQILRFAQDDRGRGLSGYGELAGAATEGDQTGCESSPGSSVRRLRPEPSAFMTYSSRFPSRSEVKASRLPSGDH